MHIQLTSSALLLALATATGVARADEPPPTVLAEPGARASVAADPNLDRGFVLPTAMTQPAGSITYNNYELLLHGVTVGITDRFQMSATVLAPIVEQMPLVGLVSAKGRIYAGQRFHLALQGSLGAAKGGWSDDGALFTAGAGTLASWCLRQDCSSLLSGSVTYQLVTSDESNEGAGGLVYGVSAVHRVGRHVKLLAEVASAANLRSPDFADGALVNYGVRFYSGSIAGDVGFIKPVGDGGGFILGLPFASISYRWQ
jgi:hypothetical protein